MPDATLSKRVAALEMRVQEQVTIRDLEALQGAIGAQILQLGAEMRAEFSALRGEMRAGDEETRRTLRAEVRAVDERLNGVIEQRTAELLAVIAAQSEEDRRFTRVLHEDLVARIETIRGK